MKRRLVSMLAAAGLMAAIVPGVTVAQDYADKDSCKKGGFADWVRIDGSTFDNQGDCVSHVATGHVLRAPVPVTISYRPGPEGPDGATFVATLTWRSFLAFIPARTEFSYRYDRRNFDPFSDANGDGTAQITLPCQLPIPDVDWVEYHPVVNVTVTSFYGDGTLFRIPLPTPGDACP